MSLSFIPVVSSNIRAIAYDANTRELFVQFISDTIYRYDEVPVAIYLAFIRAESYGKFFYKSIRTDFVSTKLESLPKPCILITVDGGVADVVGVTIDCNVIIIDKDTQESGEDSTSAYEMQAISDTELDRLIRLEQNDFPSEEE